MLNSDWNQLTLKDLGNSLWTEIERSADKLKVKSKNLTFDFKDKLTKKYIVSKCRKVIEKDGLDLVIIDAIDGSDESFENIISALMQLCKKFRLAVFVCLKDI